MAVRSGNGAGTRRPGLAASPAAGSRAGRLAARAAGLALAALVAALACPAAAGAHLGNLSYADFDVSGSNVMLRFQYAIHVTPGMVANSADKPTRAEVLALQVPIENWLCANSRVTTKGRECRCGVDNLVGPDRDQNLEVLAAWHCDTASIAGVTVDFHPLDAVMDDWQTIATLRIGGASASTVFTRGASHWQVGEAENPPGPAAEAAAANASRFGSFFSLGVQHIWTGYDHLLFLLAVLLAGGGLARLAAIVTSFTIAHSITLGAATTGLVHLPAAPVEAAIALSIVYVAAENLLDLGADRRALVTFAFGLVHGFGFASVLAETALPTGGILVPLLAFNLGVEAGQLAVVAVVVPFLALALRGPHARRVKLALSALIALAGAVWALLRIAAIVAG